MAAMIIVIRIIALTTVEIIDVFVLVPRESFELWLNVKSVTVVAFSLKASSSMFSSTKLPSSEMKKIVKIGNALLNSVSMVISSLNNAFINTSITNL